MTVLVVILAALMGMGLMYAFVCWSVFSNWR